MDSKYETLDYQKGDENQIIPLLVSAFGLWPFHISTTTPAEHWLWRYFDKYPGIVTTIHYENDIIGCNHATLNEYRIFGKITLSSYGTDTAISSTHRGKGLYRILTTSISKLAEEAEVDFRYTMTTNPLILNSRKFRETWPHPFPFKISLLTRIENLKMHKQAQKNKRGLLWYTKEWIIMALASPIKDPEMIVSEVKLFDSRVKEFLDKINEGYDFILNRTRDYLNWRYCDPRGGYYTIKMVEEEGEILGYIVTRMKETNEYRSGSIVDLLTIENRLDVAEALLLSVLNYYKENKVNITSFQVIQDHPFETLLKRYGFRRRKEPRQLYYNYFGSYELERIPPSRIHFPFGDIAEDSL